MKGDFSRVTYRPTQHLSRVLMQQGRVLLDADWNEQAAILLHYLQTLAADLIGTFGGPEMVLAPDGDSAIANAGFEITRPDGVTDDFNIGPGRYYVDGVLCENEPRTGDNGKPLFQTYFGQDDLPLDKQADKLPDSPILFYLDAWEQHLTYVDLPEIREVALGGADTASRARVVWQVKALDITGDNVDALLDNDQFALAWSSILQLLRPNSAPQMAAWTLEPSSSGEPCITPPSSHYRGLENQLYRVEIHNSGTIFVTGTEPPNPEKFGYPEGTPTFKWSRENGSVVAAWASLSGNEVTLGGFYDRQNGFASGKWVELISRREELRGEPGQMAYITGVDGDTLTVEPATNAALSWSPALSKPKVRRWDQPLPPPNGGPSYGVIEIKSGETIELEQGIAVTFTPQETDCPMVFRAGDYWLIPARTEGGEVYWPHEENPDGTRKALPQTPHGVEHHYAPLAVVDAAGTLTSIRKLFKPVVSIP